MIFVHIITSLSPCAKISLQKSPDKTLKNQTLFIKLYYTCNVLENYLQCNRYTHPLPSSWLNIGLGNPEAMARIISLVGKQFYLVCNSEPTNYLYQPNTIIWKSWVYLKNVWTWRIWWAKQTAEQLISINQLICLIGYGS